MKYQLVVLFCLLNSSLEAQTPLVLLHTADTHSHLEAVDDGVQSRGGIVRREALVRGVRKEAPLVILLDAGDFVQGTPYYNLLSGKAEIKTMNFLKYDAVTLGNHEFDNGPEALFQLLKWTKFDVICSNYVFKEKRFSKKISQWKVVRKGDTRIGIVSANIAPFGLISDKNFINIQYVDPIQTADSIAAWLKSKMQCDVVICLSHLGLDRTGSNPDDLKLAEKSSFIDIVVGGHTHSITQKPRMVMNQIKEPVVIHHSGSNGLYVGRLDVSVTQSKAKKQSVLTLFFQRIARKLCW
jgi:5'-nucleotidase